MQMHGAFALFNMVNIVLTEAFQACQYHFGSFKADGAVGAIGYVFSSALD